MIDTTHLRELAFTHEDDEHTSAQLRAAADEIDSLKKLNAKLTEDYNRLSADWHRREMADEKNAVRMT